MKYSFETEWNPIQERDEEAEDTQRDHEEQGEHTL